LEDEDGIGGSRAAVFLFGVLDDAGPIARGAAIAGSVVY